MGTLKVTMWVDKAAAVKGGLTDYGTQVVEIDPATLSADEQAELVNHHPSGCDQYDYSVRGSITVDNTTYGDPSPEPAAVATQDAIVRLLHWHMAKRAAKIQELTDKNTTDVVECIGKMQRWLELDGYAKFSPRLAGYGRPYSPYGHVVDYPTCWMGRCTDAARAEYCAMEERCRAERDQRATEAARLTAEDRDRRAREAAEAEAKKQAEEGAKKAQLDDAVLRLGTDIQRERWAAGVMPVREAVDLIVAEAVAPIVAVVGRERISPNDTHYLSAPRSGCKNCEVDWVEKKTLTDAEWTAWKAVRDVLPKGATWEFYRESVDCDYHEEHVATVVANARWTVGVINIDVCIFLSSEE